MKKILIFLCPFFLIVLQSHTIIIKPKQKNCPEFQNIKSTKITNKIDKVSSVYIELLNKKEDTTLYVDTSLKVKPVYPGGTKIFNDHINIVLENPKNKKGEILVCFIIEKNGSLSKIKILKGIDDETDKEILKVLKHSPKWKPGEKEEQKVRCMIPLFLTINGGK